MNATDSFLSALTGITGTGDFHSTGMAPFFLPSLVVKGVGEIAFPQSLVSQSHVSRQIEQDK